LCTQRLRETCKRLRAVVLPPLSIHNILFIRPEILDTCDFDLLSCLESQSNDLIFRQPAYDLILKHKKRPWTAALTRHSELYQLVENWARGPFSWDTICGRADMTVAFVRQHLGRFAYPHYFKILSANTASKAEDIEASLDLPWEWPMFGANTSLSADFYHKHRHKPIDWQRIAHLSTEDMLRFPTKEMHWAWAWSMARTREQQAVILLQHVSLM
jgi:hypothetical protein